MNWRRAAGLLAALTLALTLTACVRGRGACPPAPVFGPTVDGQPLAMVLTYGTKARWNTVTYAIYAGEEKVQGGRLNANKPALKLPDKPGTFIVTIRGENRHGHSNTYFKILSTE